MGADCCPTLRSVNWLSTRRQIASIRIVLLPWARVCRASFRALHPAGSANGTALHLGWISTGGDCSRQAESLHIVSLGAGSFALLLPVTTA